MSYSFQLVSQITLILSGLGLLVLVFRKIPELLKISEEKILAENETSKLLKKIRQAIPLKNFSYEIFLQKVVDESRA